MFKSTANDDQDSVRLLSIQIGIELCDKLSPEEIGEHILPIAASLSRDSSWRVRYMVADKLVKVCTKNPTPIVFNSSNS